ncbi:hypothetical protein ACTJKN_02150 [Pedobacter sp. 22163]|uniref:hypothetical protein n=1 Tax=Pedobacter sp. 22163 TaxID=3453883 RepID=UPI003F8728E7
MRKALGCGRDRTKGAHEEVFESLEFRAADFPETTEQIREIIEKKREASAQFLAYNCEAIEVAQYL